MPKHDADQPQPRPHKQNFIARLVNRWFDRVVGAMKGEGLSAAEAEYAPHRTTRDFIWNTAGQAAWAFVFPVMTMVSTQLVGVEQAGMISMAFIVALLLMFVGNFGTRAYQVSDISEEHSFADYQVSRWITCILMLVVGWLYCTLRGYQGEMFDISMGVILFKFVDALADVYEGRLQQADKLYLAGISQTLRSVVALVAFCVAMLISRSSVVACYAMGIAAIVIRGGHLAAHPDGNAEEPRLQHAQLHAAVQGDRAAVRSHLPVQRDREHAEVRDGRQPGLRESAVLQRAVLPRADDPDRGAAGVQAAVATHDGRVAGC